MTKGRVALCTPSLAGPMDVNIKAVTASLPLIKAAGWESAQYYHELGNAYISQARSKMLGQAMREHADVIVFIDYDLSWRPQDLLTLIETPGEVVAGTYRYKHETVEFMVAVAVDENKNLYYSEDGCVMADRVCAGFLKVTRGAVERFEKAYPWLVYHTGKEKYVDLFNHGAHNDQWWGEDYAFCRNWRALGGQVWVVPDLTITHHTKDAAYTGNFAESIERTQRGHLLAA